MAEYRNGIQIGIEEVLRDIRNRNDLRTLKLVQKLDDSLVQIKITNAQLEALSGENITETDLKD